MRAFLALDPPAPVIRALAAVQGHLVVGNLVPEDDLHLTLAFLGDVRVDALDDLVLDLEMLHPGPQRIEITGLDTFGSAEPRSLHARIAPDPGLLHLQRKVATLVRRAGLPLPRSRFVPHVTIARLPRAMAADDHARLGRFLTAHGGIRTGPEVGETLSLWRSTLTADGPRYDLLERYALA